MEIQWDVGLPAMKQPRLVPDAKQGQGEVRFKLITIRPLVTVHFCKQTF